MCDEIDRGPSLEDASALVKARKRPCLGVWFSRSYITVQFLQTHIECNAVAECGTHMAGEVFDAPVSMFELRAVTHSSPRRLYVSNPIANVLV